MDVKVEVSPPQINEDTLKKMTEFFLKTSIPRLIEERKGVN